MKLGPSKAARLLDRLVPQALLDSREHALRARVVALISLVLGLAALPAVATMLAASGREDPRLWLSVLGGACQLTLLVCLGRGVPLPWLARAQLVVLTTVLVGFFAAEGGLPGTTGPWLVLAPGVAVLTLGPRSGWAWAVVLVLGVGFMSAYSVSAHPPEVAQQALLQGASLILALPVFTAWVAFFEDARLESIRASDRALAELEARNREAMDARDLAIEASQARSEFLARTSHELRTPMTAVLGMLDLLLGGNLGADEQDQAETAKEAARALLTVLDDILDIGRLDAGKLRVNERSFDPRGPVEGAVALVAHTARERGLHLGCFVGPAVPAEMQGDPDRLRQVVLNLVANAVRYTDAGDVAVRASLALLEGGPALRVEVSDSGIGIDLAATPRTTLFRPFEQGERFAARSHEGTGLGLAIASQLVTLMGGSMDLESELGHGSRFWFTLPLGERAGPPPAPPAEIDGKRVLVIQGPRTPRDMMISTLRDWGRWWTGPPRARSSPSGCGARRPST